MEFNKLKGFWKGHTGKSTIAKKPLHVTTGAGNISQSLIQGANSNNNNSNKQDVERSQDRKQSISTSSTSNDSVNSTVDRLDEIQPEITAEGFGLRTPYGTHLSLDFLKYCQEVAEGGYFKDPANRQLRVRPRSISSSLNSSNSKLSTKQSVESLDISMKDDTTDTVNQIQTQQGYNSIMETRRRLDAFRSFRTKRRNNEQPTSPKSPLLNGSSNTQPRNFVEERKEMTPGTGLNSLLNAPLTAQNLHIVREQMAAALKRLRHLEEEVKQIPVLHVQISVLQQEKQKLYSQVKQYKETSSTSGQIQTNDVPKSFKPKTASSEIDVYPPPPPKRKYKSVGTITEPPVKSVNFGCYVNHELLHTIDPQDRAKSVTKRTVQTSTSDLLIARTTRDACVGSSVQTRNVHTYMDVNNSRTNACTTTFDLFHTANVLCGSDIAATFLERGMNAVVSTQDAKIGKDINLYSISHEKETSTDDLRVPKIFSDMCVGESVYLKSAYTNTEHVKTQNSSTATDDLICKVDVYCGKDYEVNQRDVGITVKSGAKDVKVGGMNPICLSTNEIGTITENPYVIKFHKDYISTGTGENSILHVVHAATNTVIPVLVESATATEKIEVCNESSQVLPDTRNFSCNVTIQSATSEVSTTTDPVLTTQTSTMTECVRCDDVSTQIEQLAILEKSTLTDQVVTTQTSTMTERLCYDNASTQSKIVAIDAWVSADIHPISNDASTDTPIIDRRDFISQTEVSQTNSSTMTVLNNKDISLQTISAKFTETGIATNGLDTPQEERFRSVGTGDHEITENEEKTNITTTCDASTNTVNIEQSVITSNTQEIEKYVGKVQELLEEQQSLLANKYEELEDVLIAEDSISVNEVTDRPQSLVLRTVSSSFTSTMTESDSAMSGDIELTTEGTSYLNEIRASIEENRTELTPIKSIMRKQGTPLSEKKTLRFAEGVKTDETSDEDTSSSEEEEDNLEEEVSDDEKSDKDSTGEKEALKDIWNKRPVRETSKSSASENSYKPTPELKSACSIIENDSANTSEVERCMSLIQREWFSISAQSTSSPNIVTEFISQITEISTEVVKRIVNLMDASGNSALHYALSHGNLPVVSALLEVSEMEVDQYNHAGFTPSMLAAIVNVKNKSEEQVLDTLFKKANVNLQAKQASQTALMLAVSHGQAFAATSLLKAGADINMQDADGSTALMCATEHGYVEIVKQLLSYPECDASLTDKDGSTAMGIAMESGHRNISFLLYARLNLSKSPNPFRSQRPGKSSVSLISSMNKNFKKS